MLKLTIHTDNAAFEDDMLVPEVARILRTIADKVDSWDGYEKFQNLHDVNGNPVGTWQLTTEDD